MKIKNEIKNKIELIIKIIKINNIYYIFRFFVSN